MEKQIVNLFEGGPSAWKERLIIDKGGIDVQYWRPRIDDGIVNKAGNKWITDPEAGIPYHSQSQLRALIAALQKFVEPEQGDKMSNHTTDFDAAHRRAINALTKFASLPDRIMSVQQVMIESRIATAEAIAAVSEMRKVFMTVRMLAMQQCNKVIELAGNEIERVMDSIDADERYDAQANGFDVPKQPEGER